MIAAANDFVVFDEMQFTKRDWRTRNKIKTADGPQWLSIPVNVKGKFLQKISETTVSDRSWALKHWNSICHAYARAPFFKLYQERFAALYQGDLGENLSQINQAFIREICSILSINTRIHQSSDFDLAEDRTERLVNICAALGAKNYVTGPRAKDYIEETQFQNAGICLSYFDFSGYAPYSQQHGEFTHEVTILDLLFNVGPEARQYMKIGAGSSAFENNLTAIGRQ